jgi:predicted DNA-binding transcriptional regulator AlpA
MNVIIENDEYIDLEEVLQKVGMKQANLYIKMRYNAFPKPRKLPGTSFWRRSEIDAYLESTRSEETGND